MDDDDTVIAFPRQLRATPQPRALEARAGLGQGISDYERSLYLGFLRDALINIDGMAELDGLRELGRLDQVRRQYGLTWSQVLGDPRGAEG